jgi:Zn-dependent peptidase ImmA (M78 family)
MKITELLVEGTESKATFVDMFKKFAPLAMEHIGLENLPKMVFITDIEDSEQPTFGMYSVEDKTLYVSLANRHPNDILRTIAHELTHYKQDTEHSLHNGSGETGSDHENEANSAAGVVMRHFNKRYPEYLKVKPVVIERWSKKYKSSINCANPKGFSQRAHCQGRKKNEDIEENFADGKNPQDKGDSKRHGINTKASVSSLRKTAKQGGRKGQLAHWLANMKAGRAKK